MKKNTPLVSIIVPSFNQAHYLDIALASVMYQEYPNIEIIICNHGSTDNTSEVISNFVKDVKEANVSFLEKYTPHNPNSPFTRKYSKRYPQGRTIIVIESKNNIGGTSSYNEGFKVASGKYCTYLVGDDYFFPYAISEMVAALEKTACDFVYADMFVIDDKGKIVQHLTKPDYSFKTCFADWFHLGVCKLYSRQLHKKVGGYDPVYKNANDYDMYLRFAIAGASFYHLNRTLYCVRQHSPDGLNEPASWKGDGYNNLLKESIICSQRARKYLAKNSGDKQ